MNKVSFTAMAHGTVEDFQLIESNDEMTGQLLNQQIIDHLLLAKGDDGAYQIDRLAHALQAASRAEALGADDDWVFAALLHDIGDTLAPNNHDRLAADLIEPYVRPEVSWVISKHGAFQGIYYWHHIGRDRFAREKYRTHPWFEHAVAFCHLFDQNSFDPQYPTPDIDHFRGLIDRVLARQPYAHNEAQGLEAMGIGAAHRDEYLAVLNLTQDAVSEAAS